MKNRRKDILSNIKCECGYQNHKDNVERYGTCRGCGRVLDSKAKFNYEMYVKLRLWRKPKCKSAI